MTRAEVILVLAAVWVALIVLSCRWMGAAREAGERVDQTWADHHHDKDQT